MAANSLDLLLQAAKYLDKIKDKTKDDPIYYNTSLEVLALLGAPSEVLNKILDAGIAG